MEEAQWLSVDLLTYIISQKNMKREVKLNIFAGFLFLILAALITWFSVYHSTHMSGGNFTYPAFLYSIAITALVLGGVITYLFEERIEDKKVESLMAMLPVSERKIMKVLVNKGEIEQKKLVSLTGMSRVKVSRTLSKLEDRGIIDKKKHGYTNLIIFRPDWK